MRILYPSGRVACELDDNLNVHACANPQLARLIHQYKTKGMDMMTMGDGYVEDEKLVDGIVLIPLSRSTLGLFDEKIKEMGLKLEV